MKKKIRKIIIYSLALIISLIYLTYTQLAYYGANLDYYWNFNIAYQISRGLVPYKEISFIFTPLLPFIEALILTVFGKNILAYVVSTSLFKILLCFFNSKIAYEISKSKKVSIITYIITIFILSNHYYDYNYHTILIDSIIILLELNNKDNIKKNILIGILASLSLLTKQSIGLFITIFVLLKPIIFNDKNKKNILYRFLGITIPLIIFFSYLMLTKTINSFINYTVLGLKEFNNKFTFIESIKLAIKNKLIFEPIMYSIILLSALCCMLHHVIDYIKKTKCKDQIIIYYQIAGFTCFYPIMDNTHLMISVILLIPLLSHFIYKIITRIKFNKLQKNIICFGIFYSLLLIYIRPIIYYNNAKSNEKLVIIDEKYKILEHQIISKQEYDFINQIIEFEKNNETIILDKEAVIFHLPQNKYYKNYDMFMRGNFGENGEEKLIEEIKQNKGKNIKYLLNKETCLEVKENKNINIEQIPINVTKYVMDNGTIIGDIDYYYIYVIN